MRQRFRVDHMWVERREAILRDEEDRIFREARDRATGEERGFIDAIIAERERNRQAQRDRREQG